MEVKNCTKEEILALAEKTKRSCDLLIEQCDSWLSEEEGMKNMQKRIRERKKKNGSSFFDY